MMKPQKKGNAFTTLEALLLSQQIIAPEQVEIVHQFIAEHGVNFGTAVMFLNLVPGYRLSELLERELRIRSVTPQKMTINPIVKSLLPADRAKQMQVFPLQVLDESGSRLLILGMTDPLETMVVQRVEGLCHMKVQPAFLSLDDLQWAFRKFYRGGLSLFPPEVTHAGERTVSQRFEGVNKAPPKTNAPMTSFRAETEMKALLAILVRKGILTLEEFSREVAKYAP